MQCNRGPARKLGPSQTPRDDFGNDGSTVEDELHHHPTSVPRDPAHAGEDEVLMHESARCKRCKRDLQRPALTPPLPKAMSAGKLVDIEVPAVRPEIAR